ncbi:MAG: diguanylate cyclase [Porticoccaceae bacterium]|nr:diguanylate cyclase [Porticoccaceae bacterium]
MDTIIGVLALDCPADYSQLEVLGTRVSSILQHPTVLGELEEFVFLIDQLKAKLERGDYVDSADLISLRPYCRQDPEEQLLGKLRELLGRFDLEAAIRYVDKLGQPSKLRLQAREDDLTGGDNMEIKPVVLIVDDAPSNIQLLAGLLNSSYQIKVANGGLRCLELAEAEPSPDLILLDIQMPDMDGYEVCQRLKQSDNTKNIPVIFVTGKDQVEEEELGLSIGAVDYITKPYSPAIVEARIATQITLKQQSDALRNLAMRDQLTGLYNRHFLINVAEKRISQAHRHRQPLCLIMIDVDHFKAVNDQHGHSVGDDVLREVARIFVVQSRNEDVVARFGGEEFVFLLDACDLEAGVSKAEKVRQSLEDTRVQGLAITASFGLAQLAHGEDFLGLLNRADEAVYEAKSKGRNRVEVAEEAPV